MFHRGKHPQQVKEAIRAAEAMLPESGEVEGLLDRLSQDRGRPMTLLVAPLASAVSGILISTEKADYVAVSEGASPERQCAIVCHEIAHALLGHDEDRPLSESLLESGLLRGLDPSLIHSVVAARHAYAHSSETDAEIVATYISVELRRRVMRGGHTYYDELWR